MLLSIAAQQKIWFTLVFSCVGKRSLSLFAGTRLIFAFRGMVMFRGAGILILGCLGRVDHTTAGVFFMSSFAVAIDLGRYFPTASADRPGHDEN